MKILFINSHSADYVQDLTYSGLVKLLGTSNVIDIKWNKKFHVPYKKYPKNLGYTPGTLIGSYFRAKTYHDYDLVAVGASKVDCFETYLEIADTIPADVPVIFIDGGDRETVGGDLTVYGRPELYEQAIAIRPFDFVFKREMLFSHDYPENCAPLPISFNPDRLPKNLPVAKRYDVSFWAVESDPIRTEALEILEPLYDCKANGTEKNQKFSRYKRKGTFYLEELNACKIVLNFRGGGWDTMRYWEVPAVGAFMLSQKPQIAIPHDFEGGKHAVFCSDDLSDLIEKCDYYLKHEAKRERIAKTGHAHLMQYHTDLARATYIIDTLKTKGILL